MVGSEVKFSNTVTVLLNKKNSVFFLQIAVGECCLCLT